LLSFFGIKKKRKIYILKDEGGNMEQVDGEYTFEKCKVFFVIALGFFLRSTRQLTPIPTQKNL
jgi:hypothetical protein